MLKLTSKKLSQRSGDESMLEDFERDVERKRQEALARISSIPISALIWGPSRKGRSSVARARKELRDVLNDRGHLARFSEDYVDDANSHSLLAHQVAQAEAFDIVFSIPEAEGSVAEIHDFARIPWLSSKIVAFLDRAWNDGYSNRTILELQSTVTCQVHLYDSSKLPDCIIQPALDLISRLQEIYYIAGRRP
jgi:hypothetical protein